ncbi:PEP-CTERM sorting domain-containing protein [Aliiglaciecola aliphaticivorans]
MKLFPKILSIALFFSLFSLQAHSFPVYWTDWMSEDSASSATGQLDIGGSIIDVTYTNSSSHYFVQTGTATNYWTGNAYTNGSIDNAPLPSEQVALGAAGEVTISFSSAIENVYIALNSWNGQNVLFDTEIEFESIGTGYWGSGTATVNGDNTGFTASGELHGVVLAAGSHTSISFTHLTEYWHGFTIGVAGEAEVVEPDPNDIPEPSLIAILSLGLLMLGRRQFKKH